MCCLQEAYFKYMSTDRLKIKRLEKIQHAQFNLKKAGYNFIYILIYIKIYIAGFGYIRIREN